MIFIKILLHRVNYNLINIFSYSSEVICSIVFLCVIMNNLCTKKKLKKNYVLKKIQEITTIISIFIQRNSQITHETIPHD